MVREQKVIKSTKDNRAAFAASVVADMEAFANKHGLVLGKREYVDKKSWDHLGDLHEMDVLQLDAILFSGIVSAINGLEYVIIYNSDGPGFEFCMLSTDYWKTYANEEGRISWYHGKDGDHELFFGSEFKCVNKAQRDLEDQYPDFRKLCHNDWAKHCSEGALEGMMAAFRECEAKHVRREKNNADLDKKPEKIEAAEDQLPNILDVLAPMVGGSEIFNGYERHIYSHKKYPVHVNTKINTGVENTDARCYVSYKPKRDKFCVQLWVVVAAENGSEIASICGQKASWCDEDISLDRMAQYIKHCIEVAKLYGETASKMAELNKKLNGK
jgi:hypothetical protein